MGQATILSHLGGGLYRVKLLFANGIVTARIAVIELQITALDAQIADLEGQKNAAYADLQTALDAMNAYLGSVTPEQLATDPTTINALTKTAFTARAHYDTLAMRWRMAKSKKTALETNRNYLQNYCPSDITVDAWSVRFNEDLTGNAATIEVDYVLQRNSGTGQAVVNDSGVWLFPGASFDSKLQHPLASSEHATWFNLCILPAMQRDAPRYRVATLSNLNKLAGTCTVEFDGASSFDGNKLVASHPIYPHGAQSTGATISYPPCNGAAFENGDRVIVAGGNTVIGFYSNPRECPIPYTIVFFPGSETGTRTITTTSDYSYGDTDSEDCWQSGGSHYVLISGADSISGSWDALGETNYTPISGHPEKAISIKRHIYGSESGNGTETPYNWDDYIWVLSDSTHTINENRQITVDAFDGTITLPLETYHHDEPSNSLAEKTLIRDYYKITKISISNDVWFYETERRISGVSLEKRRITTNRLNGTTDDVRISIISPIAQDITEPTGLIDEYMTPCILNNPSHSTMNTSIFHTIDFATN